MNPSIKWQGTILVLLGLCLCRPVGAQPTVAREWNEALLSAIRIDTPRPTVHARNLFHVSAALYDAWAAYDPTAAPYLLGQTVAGFACSFDGVPLPADVQAAREEAMSYAAYRLLVHRFAASPGAATSLASFEALMDDLGYDTAFTDTDYTAGSAAALGNHIGQCIIDFGKQDGAGEENNYDYPNSYYAPVNPPMDPTMPGTQDLVEMNRWQPLALSATSTNRFLSPNWGQVVPFALTEEDLTVYERDGNAYWVYHDPGAPPLANDSVAGMEDDFTWTFALVAVWSSHLDPASGVMIDISPASMGNTPVLPRTSEERRAFYDFFEGGQTWEGYDVNPATGMPYEPNIVPLGDFGRVSAEFWADGPNSETPPGHWYTILNYVSDHPMLEKRFRGEGPVLDDLEWDVKSYFALGGAIHDVAVAVWGVKGWYDYVRPITAIRAMAEYGQSSDPSGASYHPRGLPLIEGHIEVVEAGDPLAGENDEHVGKMKLYAWRGPDYIGDAEPAGVGWILAENWWPYQKPSFITPPFAGYVSGHSTFSRAAAEVLTFLTGDEYFPGGMGVFESPQNEYLTFEEGPSVDVTLQYAKYRDASDQASLSRLWGGIHPPVDDVPGRLMGITIGADAFDYAESHFTGTVTSVEPVPQDFTLASVEAYPSPLRSGDRLRVELKVPPSDVEVQLYNVLGQLVASQQVRVQQPNQAVTFDTAGLPSGLYLLRTTGPAVNLTTSVVVVR